jgi:hypothetical protein
MKTKLFILGGVLAAGVVIHHTGHCPLMEAKKALTHQQTNAPAANQAPAVVAVTTVNR